MTFRLLKEQSDLRLWSDLQQHKVRRWRVESNVTFANNEIGFKYIAGSGVLTRCV